MIIHTLSVSYALDIDSAFTSMHLLVIISQSSSKSSPPSRDPDSGCVTTAAKVTDDNSNINDAGDGICIAFKDSPP